MTKQVRQAITPTHVLGSTGTAEGDDLGFREVASLKADLSQLAVSVDLVQHGLTIGRGAGAIPTNTAIGPGVLFSNTTGAENTAVGRRALRDATTGNNNVAIGADAARDSTTGNFNTAVGSLAYRDSATGSFNAAFGFNALRDTTTGNNNVAIGSSAGRSGSPFTITTQDNRIVMGNDDHTDAYIRIAWTVTSDARDKTELAPIPHGLDFINGLNPTEYQFKAGGRDGEADGRRRYGFLAQDVLALEGSDPVIADVEDPENLKLHESYLVPVLVNAIKQLTARIEDLEAKS